MPIKAPPARKKARGCFSVHYLGQMSRYTGVNFREEMTTMTGLSLLFTLAGAAAVTRGFVRLIVRLDRV